MQAPKKCEQGFLVYYSPVSRIMLSGGHDMNVDRVVAKNVQPGSYLEEPDCCMQKPGSPSTRPSFQLQLACLVPAQPKGQNVKRMLVQH